MRLRFEVSLGITALLGLQVLTTIVATRMLSRSAPAVERILEDNVTSLVAAEDLLTVLSSTAVSPVNGRPDLVTLALESARANSTIAGEDQIVARIDASLDAALAGDPIARRRVVNDVRELTHLNREAIRVTDENSRTLAIAGAWACGFLGICSFWVSVFVSRRLRARLEAPLVELDAALEAVRRGEPHRRVTLHTGPAEARRIADGVNWLLDRQEADAARPASDATLHRALSLFAIDREPTPIVVVDGDGGVVATNKAALARLDGGMSGIPSRLRRTPIQDGASWEGWTATKVPAHPLFVWQFDALELDPPTSPRDP